MKNDDQATNFISRRQFIDTALVLAGGFVIGAKSIGDAAGTLENLRQPNSLINGVQVGVITYSYRSMADQSAEGLLEDVVDSEVSAIELMGNPAEKFAGKPENPVNHRTYYELKDKAKKENITSDEQKQLDKMQTQWEHYQQLVAEWRASVSMDKFKELRTMYNDAGVDIYAWKPNVFGKDNSADEINYGFNAAKALGAKACTTEHPEDDAQTKRLGSIAAQHKIFMSYHAHTQATPTLWDTALEQSKYNAVNLDVGHYVAAGNPDPIEFIKAKHDRIESLHIKDRTTPVNGQKNLPFGQGDTPIIEILQTMRDQKYTFPAAIELEYEVPKDSNAVKEVYKCVDFCRDALTD